MYLPSQKENLGTLVDGIANECSEPTNVFYSAMTSTEDFKVKLGVLDVDLIKKYFEDALSHNRHLTTELNPDTESIKYWPYEGEEDAEEEVEALLGKDPNFQRSFKFVNDVLAVYLEDVRAVAASMGMYKISGNIEEIQEELAKEEMLSEGLPQILHDFDDQAREKPQGTNFFKGVRRMLEEGRFVNDGNKCPFGMRVLDLFAMKPERDQSTGRVTISESKEGALPEFIYTEIKQGTEIDLKTEGATPL